MKRDLTDFTFSEFWKVLEEPQPTAEIQMNIIILINTQTCLTSVSFSLHSMKKRSKQHRGANFNCLKLKPSTCIRSWWRARSSSHRGSSVLKSSSLSSWGPSQEGGDMMESLNISTKHKIMLETSIQINLTVRWEMHFKLTKSVHWKMTTGSRIQWCSRKALTVSPWCHCHLGQGVQKSKTSYTPGNRGKALLSLLSIIATLANWGHTYAHEYRLLSSKRVQLPFDVAWAAFMCLGYRVPTFTSPASSCRVIRENTFEWELSGEKTNKTKKKPYHYSLHSYCIKPVIEFGWRRRKINSYKTSDTRMAESS